LGVKPIQRAILGGASGDRSPVATRFGQSPVGIPLTFNILKHSEVFRLQGLFCIVFFSGL
jgi:hypothetical protein